MKKVLVLLIALLIALIPSSTLAQQADGGGDDLLLRINGEARVERTESVGTLIVIDDDAYVAGTVRDAVVVINGDATVTGTVEGDITVISGALDLRSTATVKDVNLIGSDLTRASGAVVSGSVTERGDFFFVLPGLAFGILFWIGMTIAVIVAGLLFAAVAGRQLRGFSGLISEHTGGTLLASAILWIGVPVVAAVAMVTLIGIPLGIGLLVFMLPVLWFLGYIVFGTWIGSFLVTRGGQPREGRPYAEAALGLLVVQVAALIPVLGAITLVLGGIWGAGAIAFSAWHTWRGPRVTPEQTPPAATATPVP
jgi:hypothetical protein